METDSLPTAEKKQARLGWYRYSLLFLLLFVLLASIGAIAVKMKQAREQRAAVAIEKLGGSVIWTDPLGKLLVWHSLRDGFFTSVLSVTLSRTEVTDAELGHLTTLSHLKELFLYQTHVTDAGLEHLKGMSTLQVLGLTNTQVTDAGLENLKGLSQLTQLSLSCIPITDAGLERLKGLSQLQILDIQRTRVTDVGLEHLTGLSQLQILRLDNTQVTEEGVKKLQQALPNCKILR